MTPQQARSNHQVFYGVAQAVSVQRFGASSLTLLPKVFYIFANRSDIFRQIHKQDGDALAGLRLDNVLRSALNPQRVRMHTADRAF